MARKTPKQSAAANKESDTDFIKRMLKTQEEETKKASEEIRSYSASSTEVRELKSTGKQVAKDLEEIEECEKIVEEFKLNPPVAISKHINGVSVSYEYEPQFKSRIKKLKKHGFGFLSAVKHTSIQTPTFNAIGRANVKRNGQRILLPKSAIPQLAEGLGMGSRLLNPKDQIFLLEDGDVIETEKDSRVVVNDFIATDKYERKIFVYPNSEAKLVLKKSESHPEPAFMDPSQVSAAIKKNSSSTVIKYNFVSVELIKGIFRLNILDENKNANNFVKLPSGYPDIEFLHSSKTIESVLDKEYAKLANVPNAAQIVASYMAKKKQSKICNEISTYIELTGNSIVIFGTMNSVKNRGTGKIASIVLPKAAGNDFAFSGKITAVGSTLYSDSSGGVDPRVRAIIRYAFAIEQYVSILSAKEDFEQKLKEAVVKKSKSKQKESESSRKEREKRKAELLEEQNYLKSAGDEEMASAIQIQIDDLDPEKRERIATEQAVKFKKELLIEQDNARKAGNDLKVTTIQMQIDTIDQNEEGIEMYLRKMIEWCDKQLKALEPDITSNFPSYNQP